MPPRDRRPPPESEPHAVELHGAPFELTHGEGAKAPGGGAQVGAGAQVWALYPLLSPAESRPAQSAPEVDLLRLLPEVARRGRRWLAVGALVGFAFGAAYLLVADSIYIVKSVLQVELRKSVIHDVDARPTSTYVGTQAEVIQSPAMIGEAIREIGLPVPEAPGLLGRLRAWIEALDPFPAEENFDPIQRAVLATLPALQASPVLGTDVLALSLRTDAPQRGVRLLDALTASYQRYVRDNETAAHREGLELLRQREAGLAAQIAELADRHREQESTIRSLGRGADALSVQRMGLEEQARARVEAQRRRIDLENELAALREERDAQVAPSREIQDELVRAEAALAEHRARLSSLHPDVTQLEQRVAGLREQVRAGGRMRVAELERQVRAARRTEGALAGLYDREWEGVKALEVERAQLEKLGAEIARLETQRTAVVALLGEKELSLLAAQAGENSGTVVRVLQAPSIPPDAVWPLPLPVLVACSFVGVLGGLGFALLSHWRESRGPQPETDRFGDPAGFDAPIPRIAQRPLR